MLRIFLFGPPKRRKQPERYVQYFMPKFFVAPRHPWRGEFIVFWKT
jgi:hypothetical protein